MSEPGKGWRRWIPQWVRKIGLGTVIGLVAAGVILWGGFDWAFELTNTERFCTSCHGMRENVFREYQHTVHYTNRSDVRATCPDCHVPKEWGAKIIRFRYMDFTEQGRRAVDTHSQAFTLGKTCIDCHKGVAHQLPPKEQEIGAPKPDSTNLK
jgi:cytochrome c-type protein NapC